MNENMMLSVIQYKGQKYVNLDDFERCISKANLDITKYKELYEQTKLEKEAVEAQLYKNIRKFFE